MRAALLRHISVVIEIVEYGEECHHAETLVANITLSASGLSCRWVMVTSTEGSQAASVTEYEHRTMPE